MKTAHYTFTTWNDSAMAAGFDGRQAAMVRQPRQAVIREEDKVIDLTAWRAANLDLLEPEERLEEDWTEEAPELVVPAPRPRKSHKAMLTAELVSTLSVAAAGAALILRILTF